MRNFIFIFISLCIFGCAETQKEKSTSIDDLLKTRVDSLKAVNDSLSLQLSTYTQAQKANQESNYWFNANYEGKKFLQKGIEDPETFIENSLRKQTDLIPMEGVLGGTMHFGKIQILSSEWLIAEFEDGHIQGKAIYKFNLNPDGEIEFELLSAVGHE